MAPEQEGGLGDGDMSKQDPSKEGFAEYAVCVTKAMCAFTWRG